MLELAATSNECAHSPVIGARLHRLIPTIELVVGLNAGAPAAAAAVTVPAQSAGQHSLVFSRCFASRAIELPKSQPQLKFGANVLGRSTGLKIRQNT